MPTVEEWRESGFSDDGWPTIGAEQSLKDHEGFDKIVLLSVSPQYLDGELIGTVDNVGLTEVTGPPHPDKCNDYIADIVRQAPDRFVGFASVNPMYQGPDRAVAELEPASLSSAQWRQLYPMISTGHRTIARSRFPFLPRQLISGFPSWSIKQARRESMPACRSGGQRC